MALASAKGTAPDSAGPYGVALRVPGGINRAGRAVAIHSLLSSLLATQHSMLVFERGCVCVRERERGSEEVVAMVAYAVVAACWC